MCPHVFGVQETLLELLREAVESSVRQGKGVVISGFPRDVKRAEEYEAQVCWQSVWCWRCVCGGEKKEGRLLHAVELVQSRPKSRERNFIPVFNCREQRGSGRDAL